MRSITELAAERQAAYDLVENSPDDETGEEHGRSLRGRDENIGVAKHFMRETAI